MRHLSTLPLVLCVLCATGCKDARIASGSDDRYIHLPEELTATPPLPTKTLFPTTPGIRWTYRLTAGDTGTEVDTILPPRQIQGQEATVIGSTRKGVLSREEFYIVTDREILQFSAGTQERVTLKPALPILRFPLSYQTTLSWQGGVSIQGAYVPSQAKSRLRAVEDVKVPAGTFRSYRVDTMLDTRLAEGQARFWTTRWFAPGVGIVKARYVVQAPSQPERVFLKELLSYKI